MFKRLMILFAIFITLFSANTMADAVPSSNGNLPYGGTMHYSVYRPEWHANVWKTTDKFRVASADGKTEVVFLGDGNLYERSTLTGAIEWHTYMLPNSGNLFFLHDNCGIAIRSASGAMLWNAHTDRYLPDGKTPWNHLCNFSVQNSGHLFIWHYATNQKYGLGDFPIWWLIKDLSCVNGKTGADAGCWF